MKRFRNLVFALVVATAFAAGAWAQMMGRGRSGPPQIPGRVNPTVGEGSEYQVTTNGEPMEIQYAVVGKESVDGKDGYWAETRMISGKGAGMVMKSLVVTGGDPPGIKRMIVQRAGQQAMEMPMSIMGGMMKQMMQSAPQDFGKGSAAMGEMVGTETVTVPAGTFMCDHYKSKDGGDFWISSKVYPYGLIKAVTKDTTIVLQKTLTDQNSEIKGEPRKIEMPHF
jgi:hypothetical protein